MTTPFDAGSGLIIVHAVLWGPNGNLSLRLALDTGATRTTIGYGPLVGLGYDPGGVAERVQVTMGGSVEYSPILRINRIDTLGESREHFPILAHTLPPSASVDGLIGLDFLRNRHLMIDFTTGQIDLT